MKKTLLSSMTSKEAQEALSNNPVTLVPMGSMETHGPQTPMGDYRITQEVALGIGEKTDSIVVPVIPFGYSDYFLKFPGTISLRTQTLFSLVEDVCLSLISHGLDHIVLVNGHDGNPPILEHVARKIKSAKGIILACISPFSFLTPEFLSELSGLEESDFGHGSEPVNSLNMHLYPEDVNMELAEKGVVRRFQGFDVRSVREVKLEEVSANIYLDFDEITSNGVIGNPFLASANKGKKMVNRMVKYGSLFVEQFKRVETRGKES